MVSSFHSTLYFLWGSRNCHTLDGQVPTPRCCACQKKRTSPPFSSRCSHHVPQHSQSSGVSFGRERAGKALLHKWGAGAHNPSVQSSNWCSAWVACLKRKSWHLANWQVERERGRGAGFSPNHSTFLAKQQVVRVFFPRSSKPVQPYMLCAMLSWIKHQSRGVPATCCLCNRAFWPSSSHCSSFHSRGNYLK